MAKEPVQTSKVDDTAKVEAERQKNAKPGFFWPLQCGYCPVFRSQKIATKTGQAADGC